MNTLLSPIFAELRSKIDHKAPNETQLLYYKRCQAAAKEALQSLKKEMLEHRFSDLLEEITFYKHTLPSFLELDNYYTELYDLEIEKSSLNPEDLEQYIKDELHEIDRFIFKNKNLYVYMLKEETALDNYYFTVQSSALSIYDPHFCVLNSHVVARIHALEKYRKALHSEQDLISQTLSQTTTGNSNIEFMGTDADLVEIIPALVKLRLIRIDGIPATQDQLAKAADHYLGRNIQANFSVIDGKNRSRKKTITPFLTRLKEAFEKRNDDLLK